MPPREPGFFLVILVSWLIVAQPSTASSCPGSWKAWQDQTDMDTEYRGKLDDLKDSLSEFHPDLQELVFDDKRCPFGTPLPFDVTWPGPPTKKLDGVVEPINILKKVAVIYGYVPFLPLGCVFAQFCVKRGTRQLWVLLWVALLVLVNEKIVKKLTLQPRPGALLELRGPHGLLEGSCALSCGMPSSHSALATGWFVLSCLDAVFRISSEEACNQPQNEASEFNKASNFCKLFRVVPWVQKDILTHTEFIAFVGFWGVMMLPVPFMRVVLHDHSNNQVACGTIIGGVLAIAWWRVVRVLQRTNQTSEGQQVFYGLLTHDYVYKPQPVTTNVADPSTTVEMATHS